MATSRLCKSPTLDNDSTTQACHAKYHHARRGTSFHMRLVSADAKHARNYLTLMGARMRHSWPQAMWYARHPH